MDGANDPNNDSVSSDDSIIESTPSRSTDDIDEVQKLVKHDNRKINCWRVTVGLALFSVGAVVTWMTHNFLVNEEGKNFESAVSAD